MSKLMRSFPVSAFSIKGSVEAFVAGQKVDGDVPVKIVARSAGVVDVPLMGKVVHDFAGMTVKDRFPLDYQHDPKLVIGFGVGSEIEVADEGAVIKGLLTPMTTDDMASRVAHNMSRGVPYEASIYFPPSKPDDVLVEFVPEGNVAEVNGQQFAGPVNVIRKWPLRGVAITPYGMDSATSAEAMSNEQRECAVSFVTQGQDTTGGAIMTDEEKAKAEVEAKAKEEAEQKAKAEAEAKAKVEAAMAASGKKSFKITCAHCNKGLTVSLADNSEIEVKKDEEDEEMSAEKVKAEFNAMCQEFGDAFAAKAMKEGMTMEAARQAFTAAVVAENKELKAKLDVPGFDGSRGAGRSAFDQLSKEQQAEVTAYCARYPGADKEKIAAGLLKK